MQTDGLKSPANGGKYINCKGQYPSLVFLEDMFAFGFMNIGRKADQSYLGLQCVCGMFAFNMLLHTIYNILWCGVGYPSVLLDHDGQQRNQLENIYGR